MLRHPGNNTSTAWGRFAQQHRTYERTDPMAKLMARVVVDDDTECWVVATGAMKNGYPYVAEGKHGWHYGHRLAYRRLVGPIPDEHRVHHRCENTRCVNPEHLEPLTAKEHAEHHGFGVGPCLRCGSEDWHIRKDTGARQCRECRRRRRRAAPK